MIFHPKKVNLAESLGKWGMFGTASAEPVLYQRQSEPVQQQNVETFPSASRVADQIDPPSPTS